MIALALAQAGDVAGFGVDQNPVTGRAVLVSMLVVAVVVLVAWAVRRYLPAARGRRDFAVERALPLGDRRTLVIVSVENRRLLLGMTAQQVSLIAELQSEPGGSFRQALDNEIASGAAS